MRTIVKRTIALCAALLVLTAMLATVTVPVSAASKPSLSKKKVTMTEGKTMTLKVRNATRKVKWISSDKKVVRISKKSGKNKSKATLKAVGAGTCTIRAKIGKKTLKCKVTVKTKDGIKIKKLSSSSVNITASVKAGTSKQLDPSPQFVNSTADFSVELLKNTVKQDKANGKNVNTLISPDSVLTALVMVENGAKGDTLKEMEDTLSGGISVSDFNGYLSGINNRLGGSKNVIFRSANSIWTRKGKIKIKNDFLKKNKAYHNAEVYRAPFNSTTVNDMNSWVYNNTRNMIKKIISQLSPLDRVVLINAIAFEGKWEQVFEYPFSDTFTTEKGTKQTVTMLGDTGQMKHITLAGGNGFARYYRGRSIAFVGLLPPEGTDVDTYLDSLTGEAFVKAWKNKKSEYLAIRLPEFKYDYSASMVPTLMQMGMKKAFTDGADFSGMFVQTPETRGLCIDDVLHKTYIELDRNGTKAAAATAVVMKASSAYMEEPIRIYLDRPFVYALVDTKTGIPLFIGILRSVK